MSTLSTLRFGTFGLAGCEDTMEDGVGGRARAGSVLVGAIVPLHGTFPDY